MPVGAITTRPYRILVVGESTAAGVGVATQVEGLAGQLADLMAMRLLRPVSWRVIGRSGITASCAAELIAEEPACPGQQSELAVVDLGVNDVLERTAPGDWTRHVRALVDGICTRLGAQCVALSSVPPMQRFVGLPQPLRAVLGRRARTLDACLKALASEMDNVRHVALSPSVGPGAFAGDRFHPSAAGYRAWALRLANAIQPVES